MTSFLAKPLSSLSAIYRFVGGLRGTSAIDLVSPILLVHDVSRESEQGASLMFNQTHSVTTGGAGVAVFTTVEVLPLFTNAVPGRSLTALGRTPDNTDVYLMHVYALVTAAGGANLNRSIIGLRPPNNGRYVSTAGQSPRPIFFGQTQLGNSDLVAGGQLIVERAGGTAQWRNRLPARVETVFQHTQDDAGGAATVTYGEIFAFVPIGAQPPLGN